MVSLFWGCYDNAIARFEECCEVRQKRGVGVIDRVKGVGHVGVGNDDRQAKRSQMSGDIRNERPIFDTPLNRIFSEELEKRACAKESACPPGIMEWI